MRRFAFVFVIVALLLAAVSILLLNSLFIVQRIAVVEVARGQVERQPARSDLWQPLVSGDRVHAGDAVRTGVGAVAELGWVDGTRVRLAEKTVLKVRKCAFDELNKTQTSLFRLDVGKVWVRLMNVLSRGSKFDIETPAATAGVRGTIFSVSVAPDGATSVSVYRGRVAVGTGDTSAIVPEGNEVAVTPDRAAEDVRALSHADERAWREQESVIVPHLEITQTCTAGDVVQVSGLAEPGADLRVNGRQVPVDRRGRFAATGDLAAVRDRGGIDVVATDRYGVKAEAHQDLDRSTGEPCPPR